MKIVRFGAAAAASLALLAPLGASAQQLEGPPTPHGPYNPALAPNDPDQNLPPERRVPDWSIDRRVAWTEQQLQQAQSAGSIDASQLQRAQAQLATIKREEARLKNWHGLYTKSDQQYLFHRLDQVNMRLGFSSPPWGV
jgi:hypothetical protein